MPYLGSSPRTINTRATIDHRSFTGAEEDDGTYYIWNVNYTPGMVSVVVRGVHMADSDYVATNGTQVKILKSILTLDNANDDIEIVGYTAPVSQVLERSDVNITGGQASNLEKVDSKFYLNKDTFTTDLTVPAGFNCFLCGPVDFTGTVNVEGVMNIL